MKQFSIYLAVLFFLIRCNSESNFIIPADYKKYEKEFHQGKAMTQKEVSIIISKFEEEIKRKTIGKNVPKVIIEDSEGNKTELRKIITSKTLCLLSDAHCGWGTQSLSFDMPIVLKKLDSNKIKLNTVCLLVKSSYDIEHPKTYETFFTELKKKYPQLYKINESEARKLNIYGSPTRLIISKDYEVLNYNSGADLPDSLYNELSKLLK